MIPKIRRPILVILGDGTVGKTAIAQSYTTGGREYPKNYNMTLMPEVLTKLVKFPKSEDMVELIILDCPSLESYTEFLPECWGQADLLLIVYDINSKDSFSSVDSWYALVEKGRWNGENNRPIGAVLFANKTDVQSSHKTTPEDGESKAKQYNMSYFSGSAKDYDASIDNAFFYLANKYQNSLKTDQS